MGSVTPRASVLWEDTMSDYFHDEEGRLVGPGPDDERTALDKTIDKVGMGTYQWALLWLCGFGWMADNMWLQAIAIALPRIQAHYSIPDNYIGVVSSCMFAGMMFGAVGWGTCSDLLGRSAAFNLTLFFTSIFGILTSLSWSYTSLCVILFFLGTAVGGSMPTDGTLLLEYMPRGRQYLVTLLSVFFSFGSVVSAIVALLVVPGHSCTDSSKPCDDNNGWKYLLVILGLITLGMFIARMVFFRLHESPRFLVNAGRHQEALDALEHISKFNGTPLVLELADVQDVKPLTSRRSSDEAGYSATGTSSPTQLEGHLYGTPAAIEQADPLLAHDQDSPEATEATPRPALRRPISQLSRRRASSYYEKKVYSNLPSFIRRPLWAWWDRIELTLTPDWRRTTILVWIVWCSMSLAFTMFNVYLPKLLEARGGGSPTASLSDSAENLEKSLWNVVVFALGGCPGAVLGAYLVQSPLGRRMSLASSTFITGFFCVVFVLASHPLAVQASTVAISLSATTMWAVLYGWTPEIFETEVRGTACGMASALSRIGAMVGPILGGVLLATSTSVPVYTSATVFMLSGACVLLLTGHERDTSAGDASSPGIVH